MLDLYVVYMLTIAQEGCALLTGFCVFVYLWLLRVFVAAQASLQVRSAGLLVLLCRLLISVVSLVAQPGFQGTRASVVATPGVWSVGSVVVAHRLSCSVACRIFPDQG